MGRGSLKLSMRRMGKGSKPCHEGSRYSQVILKGGFRKTVAFSAWQYPYTLTEDQRREKEVKDSKPRDEPPEGSNSALVKDFARHLAAGRKKWIVPKKTFCE